MRKIINICFDLIKNIWKVIFIILSLIVLYYLFNLILPIYNFLSFFSEMSIDLHNIIKELNKIIDDKEWIK